LKELTELFASRWGFSVYREGWSIKCFYGKSTKKKRESKVSPSKQRKRSTTVKDICCPFEIKFTIDDRTEEKKMGLLQLLSKYQRLL
jgi:hypothetical protein